MLFFFKNFQNIKDDISDLKKKCENFFGKEKNFQKMKIVLEELKKNEIYDYSKEVNNNNKSNYIKMFHFFNEKSQAIDFLYNHKTDDISLLYNKIEPNNRTISLKDIKNTFNCVGIFQELKAIKNLKEIIACLKVKFDDEETLKWFKNYSEIYRTVIELNQNLDFSQTIFEEIDAIIQNAKFVFYKKYDEFKYKINGGKDIEEYKNIKFEKIRELKNKIQIKKDLNLPSNDENSKKYIEKVKKLKFFKDLSEKIEEIYDLVEILRTKGSTLPILIVIKIKFPKINFFLEDNEKSFEEIYKFLSDAKINIIKKLESIYKQMTTIRFIYGKEIVSLLSYIEDDENKFDSFLRYILNLTNCEK